MKVAVWQAISGRQCHSRVDVSRGKRTEDEIGISATIFSKSIKSSKGRSNDGGRHKE